MLSAHPLWGKPSRTVSLSVGENNRQSHLKVHLVVAPVTWSPSADLLSVLDVPSFTLPVYFPRAFRGLHVLAGLKIELQGSVVSLETAHEKKICHKKKTKTFMSSIFPFFFFLETTARVPASLNCQRDKFFQMQLCVVRLSLDRNGGRIHRLSHCAQRGKHVPSLRWGGEHLRRETHVSRAENNSHILTEADIPIHPVLICNHGENELYSDFGAPVHKNNHRRADRMNDGD